MTKQSGNKPPSSRLAQFGKGVGIFFCICVLVNVVFALYELALEVIEMFKAGVITATEILLWLLGLVFSAFLAALILDALEPLNRFIRRRMAIRRSIASCRQPALSAFRSGKSKSLVGFLLVVFLRSSFQGITGRLPDDSTFRNASHQYSSLRSEVLPKALLQNKLQVEQSLFSPTYAAWQSGQKPDLEAWVHKILELEIRPHPLRHVLRLLNTLTFHRLGVSPEQGWRKIEAKEIDSQAFNRLMWVHFWLAVEVIEGWVEFRLDELDEPEPETDPAPQARDDGPPAPVRQPLLLPPPAQVMSATEPEQKQSEEETNVLTEEELAERQAEAVRMTETAFSFFTRDDIAWNSPSKVIAEIRSVLETALEYHPEPEQVHEQLAWLKTREFRLETFEEDFEKELSKPRKLDEPWNCSWLEKASVYMPTGTDGDFTVFRRNALRCYLLEDDIDSVERDEEKRPEPVEEEEPVVVCGDDIPPPPECF